MPDHPDAKSLQALRINAHLREDLGRVLSQARGI